MTSVEQKLAFLREQRQKLSDILDENPNDTIAQGNLALINTQIQQVIADKNRVPNLREKLLRKQFDLIDDRQKRATPPMVKLGVRFLAVQYIMLFPEVYPVKPMIVDFNIPCHYETIKGVLDDFDPFMVPKGLAEELALAFPRHFKLLSNE